MFARTLLTVAAAILLAYPTSAQGQVRIEFAPALGAYVPTGRLPVGSFVETAECTKAPDEPDCGGDTPLHRSANRAVAVGGRATAWFGKGGAIETAFWYSPSGSAINTSQDPGTAVVGSLRGVVNLAPRAPTMSVLLMGGPAVIQRSGFPNYSTSFGGAIGMGLDMHPGHGLGLRTEIDSYLYSLRSASGNGFQDDFVLSLAVGPFGR